MTPVLAERERLWQIEQLSRAHGPFRLMVIRPYATKTGFYRSQWLPGEVTKEDVDEEARSVLEDPRDTISAVHVWSVRDEYFVCWYIKGAVAA